LESNWMMSRFRTAWLSENLPLFVLRLLRDTAMSEFEVLSRLHARYAMTPNSREFGCLKRAFMREGYARLEPGPEGDVLVVTASGVRLLRLLEDEHRAVVSNIIRSQHDYSIRARFGSPELSYDET